MYFIRAEPFMGGCFELMRKRNAAAAAENLKNPEKEHGVLTDAENQPVMEDKAVFLPDYMREPGPCNRYYGTLTYNGRSKSWTIKGEPCVCQLAKRLFPGCTGRRRGTARFTANKRIIGDLNWLMLRYPLEIKNPGKWNEEIAKAREYVLKRERNNKYPLKAAPPEALFTGTLMEFQKEGLGFLLQNNRTLLADEMGLGKTVQALAYLAHTGAYPVLLIVPPHLIKNWEREIQRFLRTAAAQPPDVHVIRGLTPYELPRAHIYITHYLLLRGWKSVLPEAGFQTVIFDEIQELRRAGTEKYSCASLIADHCENVIGLSGTPIYNKGGEIWNVMNILDYHCLGDWDGFTREWCYGYGNGIVIDPKLLGEHLRREGLLFRRTKDKVLKELPPKRRLVQEIDSDARVYDALMESTLEKVKLLDAVSEPFDQRRLADRIAQEERQATGLAKAPYVCAFVRALLEGEEKVLLFAHHHKVFDLYKKELKAYRPVFITGRETGKQKDQSVLRFMEGRTNICVVSLRAAAGLNLQRATCVVFGELDWSPAVHSQAEDRAHRIGQQDSILCYYLVTSRGSDQDIQEALGLKVSQFVNMMGDRFETEEDRILAQSAADMHIHRVINRLRERAGLPPLQQNQVQETSPVFS
jgi:SWI/SNF-related matrix-associated actin-dependent regulator 1 of chromatin subfamily A